MARRTTKHDLDMMIRMINSELPKPVLVLDSITTPNTLEWRVLEDGKPILFTEGMTIRHLYDALCHMATGVSLLKRQITPVLSEATRA